MEVLAVVTAVAPVQSHKGFLSNSCHDIDHHDPGSELRRFREEHELTHVCIETLGREQKQIVSSLGQVTFRPCRSRNTFAPIA